MSAKTYNEIFTSYQVVWTWKKWRDVRS